MKIEIRENMQKVDFTTEKRKNAAVTSTATFSIISIIGDEFEVIVSETDSSLNIEHETRGALWGSAFVEKVTLNLGADSRLAIQRVVSAARKCVNLKINHYHVQSPYAVQYNTLNY